MDLRPPVGLGDLIRAVGQLGPDDASRAELIQFFGYELVDKSASPPPGKPEVGNSQGSFEVKPGSEDTSKTEVTRRSDNRIPAVTRLIESTEESSRPQWIDSAVPLPRRSEQSRTIPPKASLLSPAWKRGILTSALGTWGDSNEIDIPRLVNMLSRMEAIEKLPYAQIKSIAQGAVLWLDRSISMEPYLQDQAQIAGTLVRIVGETSIDIRECEGVPYEALGTTAGVPHLVLSDLGKRIVPGSRRTSSPREWASLALRLRVELAAEMIVLTPCSPSAYEEVIKQAITLVAWDRSTSVQTVGRAASRSRL